MKGIVLWLALAGSGVAIGGITVEFYGGDSDGFPNAALASECNQWVPDAWVFNDFDHGGGEIVSIWANYLMNYPKCTRAKCEIRRGVKAFDGGELMGSGVMRITYIRTGRRAYNFDEWQVKGPISLNLPPGRYHIAIAPCYDGPGRAFVHGGYGKDLGPSKDPNPPPKGTPIANGNAFFRSTHFGRYYSPVSQDLGSGTWDYGYGVEIAGDTQRPILLLTPLLLLFLIACRADAVRAG